MSQSPEHKVMKPLTRALALILLVCVGVRLADQLIGPAIPLLAILLFTVGVFAMMLRRS